MAIIDTLTLSPICSVLDGTDEACEGLTTCDLCGNYICDEHSDAQFNNGASDLRHTERWGVVHRYCLENRA